jgi:hypothetical protein
VSSMVCNYVGIRVSSRVRVQVSIRVRDLIWHRLVLMNFY